MSYESSPVLPTETFNPQVLCQYWQSGRCWKGSKCPNVHWKNEVHTPTKGWPAGARIRMYIKVPPGSPCPFYASERGCYQGDSCIYKHGEDDYRDLDEAWENYQEKMQSTTEWEAENQEKQEEEFQ